MSSTHENRVTWLGHATVLVETAKGKNILIDPFIEHNPSYPKSYNLPAEIHCILVTHGHSDHMSDVVPVAARHHSTVIAIYELASYLQSKGAVDTIGMNIGGTVHLDGMDVTQVEAKHSAGAQDEQGVHYTGVATGFVLAIQDGPVLYHAGDTTVFGDMKLIGELYHPEFAMLPIGGHYTMGPKEAALAVRLLGAHKILPLHFGTFPPLKGTPDELSKLLAGAAQVIPWKPGKAETLD